MTKTQSQNQTKNLFRPFYNNKNNIFQIIYYILRGLSNIYNRLKKQKTAGNIEPQTVYMYMYTLENSRQHDYNRG